MESTKQSKLTHEETVTLLAFLVGPDTTSAVPDPVYDGSGNPCVTDGHSWWFYNEVWNDAYGPYPSEAECREGLRAYCEVYL